MQYLFHTWSVLAGAFHLLHMSNAGPLLPPFLPKRSRPSAPLTGSAGAPRFEPFITRYPTDSSDPLKAATQVRLKADEGGALR